MFPVAEQYLVCFFIFDLPLFSEERKLEISRKNRNHNLSATLIYATTPFSSHLWLVTSVRIYRKNVALPNVKTTEERHNVEGMPLTEQIQRTLEEEVVVLSPISFKQKESHLEGSPL